MNKKVYLKPIKFKALGFRVAGFLRPEMGVIKRICKL